MDIWIYDNETVRNVEHFEEEDGVPFADWLDIPEWIEPGHFESPDDLAAVVRGGCASGAYMPAVTYRTAELTMGRHGDEVIEFLEFHDYLREMDAFCLSNGDSWAGFCCRVLSSAVEQWCYGRLSQLCSMEDPNEMLEGVRDYV